MILPVEACVKTIVALGRKFPWPRPDRCPKCGGRIWAHGFIPAFFDGFAQPLWIRRYRCPDCRAVFRMRPSAYWSRFQAEVATIRDRIAHRLSKRRWKPDLPRPRQRHWLSGLMKQIKARLGVDWNEDPLKAFDDFCTQNIAAVSRAI